MESKEEYQYIGKSEFNVNAAAKATGRAMFCQIWNFPECFMEK